MPRIVGVDGCPAGWIAVIERTEVQRITALVFRSLRDLADVVDAAVIAIDIPIGLTESGARECDTLARRHLGPKRGSSVFPAPIRAALSASTYTEASETSRQVQGKGVSKQAWEIYRKIREVDETLRDDLALQGRVVEVHPEVTFSRWAGAPIVPAKRTPEGHRLRRDLIAAHFGPDAFDAARRQVARRDAADDDIADAFAALWTAQRIVAGVAEALPAEPPLDGCGLPMRIVY